MEDWYKMWASYADQVVVKPGAIQEKVVASVPALREEITRLSLKIRDGETFKRTLKDQLGIQSDITFDTVNRSRDGTGLIRYEQLKDLNQEILKSLNIQ